MPDMNENAETQQEYFGKVHTDNKETLQNALKRIDELEVQIEKMKCCGNCKHYQFQNDARYYTCTKDGKRNGKNYRSCEFNLEKWEGRYKKMTK
jgi:hypothetical protein